MSYDHWKTTEPPDDTPWQECASCKRRDAESRMWIVDSGEWMCEDCIVETGDCLPEGQVNWGAAKL